MRKRQPFVRRDYQDPRRRIRTGVARLLRPVLGRLGFDLLLRHYYSPVPRTEHLSDDFWQSPSGLVGLEFNTLSQLRFLEDQLSPYIAEFQPPREMTSMPERFYLNNGLYQGGDADVLYGMLRHLKPRRVIEIGSGFSTLVAISACQANRQEGHETHLCSYDPYAQGLSHPVAEFAQLESIAAERLPLAIFEQLQAGDILFVDSTHTVKIGGDVTFLVLEVLPRLADGVVVHFHDVFLPWHYPREWVERNHWYWAEEYLVQAFLAFNNAFRVVFAGAAVARAHPDRLRRAIPNFDPAIPPLALWLERTSLPAADSIG
jgi:hypothetical protein